MFWGADFSALEDRIGAILSSDPNKIKEFVHNFDGHCVRAAAFFPEELEERGIIIDQNDPKSVNSIKELAPDIRQNAKPVSFLKQYGGGAGKIQKVLKCSMARATEISDSYDKLYKAQLKFAEKNIQFAKRHGFVECAFGLILRTPRINNSDSQIASAEGRSSSNAVTQSWGMLMNRAFIDFDASVSKAGLDEDILLCNTIHDAVYGLVKNDAKTIKWLNDTLIKAMEWQEDPLLQSEVKLGAELDVGTRWDNQKTLHNYVSEEEVQEFLDTLD